MAENDTIADSIRKKITKQDEKEQARSEALEKAKYQAEVEADPEVVKARNDARRQAAIEAVKEREKMRVRETYFPTPKAPQPTLAQRAAPVASNIGRGFNNLMRYNSQMGQRQTTRTSAQSSNRNQINVRGQTYVIRNKKAIPVGTPAPQQQNGNMFGHLFEIKPIEMSSKQYGNYGHLFDTNRILGKKKKPFRW